MTVGVRDNRGRGAVCARAVDAPTRHGVGTSVTAKTPNACVWSDAGKRRDARPTDARTRPPKPSTPRPNGRAADAAVLHNLHHKQRLQRRVGHAANIFCPPPLCARPGCYEPSPKSGRNQAQYCCAACRQAVQRVRDRERKWLKRGTFQGRRARARAYQAARARRRVPPGGPASATPPQTPPA